jgi:P4 family phage/plasmid primase-like protien
MDKFIQDYKEHNLITFSIGIGQKYNDKQQKWKKDLMMPAKWQKLEESKYIKSYNGLALLTGKINNIIVIDVDNIDHWKKFLQKHKQQEPITVKASSGSGGIHLYFKYTNDLDKITSSDHKFGKNYDIDVKTNGGCIIVPPTTYFNKNCEKNVSYTWINSIFEMDLIELPLWIKNILLCNVTNDKNINKNISECDSDSFNSNDDNDNNIKNKQLIIHSKKNITENTNVNSDEELTNDFTEDDIEILVRMLSKSRAEGYSEWLNVGMCLYNLDNSYRYMWKEFSKKSTKYDEKENADKWKTFRKNKNGFKIGSLLKWAKEDNEKQFDEFIGNKNLQKMIKSKYPNDKLDFGEVINVSSICKYIGLTGDTCLVKGAPHSDGSKSTNFVEATHNFISIKCNHRECHGKMYCEHFCMTPKETQMIFQNNNINNVLNVNINGNKDDDDLIEFQKIDLFEDSKLNELVFRSLNGKPVPFAEIIYYLYPDKYMFTENDTWYVFNGTRWFCINKKNTDLRMIIQQEFTTLYTTLKNYFIAKEGKATKSVKILKQIMANFDDTTFRNNVIIELSEMYLDFKNPKRDFIETLDTKQHLIGFVNGIFDLNTFEFREGKADDYISMSTHYDYKNEHTEKYKDLLQFLEDIQPNKEERDYMLTYLSIGLIGNQLELFTILTGCGRNGKSKLIELLKYTFGDYFGSVQSQMFTRPRPSAESPDPGLLSLQKKRVVIASEPEKNSKLNSGFIKFITGRDSTTLRNCHSNNMVQFTAKFITLLICNDIPECDDIDNAFSKRLRCINFPTEFVDNPDPLKTNQKKINTNINANFDYWKFDFMLLLIDYYKKYCLCGKLTVTKNILKWTDQYKEDTDLYLQFLNECTEESTTHIKTVDLYDRFKTWYKNSNPTKKIPSNREFCTGIRKYKTIEEVRVEGVKSTTTGIKYLQIIDF